MPSRHRCFLLVPTNHVRVSLRRFAFSRDGAPRCGLTRPRYPGAESIVWEVHDVEVEAGREQGTLAPDLMGDGTRRTIALDDPRWPERCPCGYVFQAQDERQEHRSRLHARSDTGELVTVHDAPVGALYDAGWFHGVTEYTRNAPGMSLVCKTPAGEWYVDGPASNGPGWTRTGTPPDIVVSPSIGIGSPQRMHGFLGGPGGNEPGWLIIDLP